jgi:hypothetical protein
VVRLATCEKTAPWESPQEIGAFVQVLVHERTSVSQPLVWRKVFRVAVQEQPLAQCG